MLIAWLARYGWPGDFAATTKATPLCDLLLIARRADSRAIGNTLMTSISGVLFVEFFAANEMTAVDVTFRMSRESVAGWRNGQGTHVMFEGEETANPPVSGGIVNHLFRRQSGTLIENWRTRALLPK